MGEPRAEGRTRYTVLADPNEVRAQRGTKRSEASWLTIYFSSLLIHCKYFSLGSASNLIMQGVSKG